MASDDEEELEGSMAQLAFEPVPSTFEMAEDKKCQYLKALLLKGYVDGMLITNMMVDGGVVVNIMMYEMMRKLGKFDEYVTKTYMMLKDFEGVVSPARGALCVDLMIKNMTLPATFFVINGKGSYNLLLVRDWIQNNYFIPSTIHQFLIQCVMLKL